MGDNEEKFQVSLDVPGVKSSDIQVNIKEDGNILSLSGSRNIDTGKGSKYSSSFTRSFYLDPAVDGEKITANLQNGVLIVSAPKHMNMVKDSIKSIPVTEIAQDQNQNISDEIMIKGSNEEAKKEDNEMNKNDVGEDHIDLDEKQE